MPANAVMRRIRLGFDTSSNPCYINSKNLKRKGKGEDEDAWTMVSRVAAILYGSLFCYCWRCYFIRLILLFNIARRQRIVTRIRTREAAQTRRF